MPSLAERIAGELDALISEGIDLLESIGEETQNVFIPKYQGWYTRALAVVRQLIPERLSDFQRQYCQEKRKIIDASTYVLDDYVRGLSVGHPIPSFDIHAAAVGRFHTQLKILESTKSRLSDILANIRGLLQADLFDSELEAARHLAKNGHLRAAGAVAGVVLEGHLKELVGKHGIKVQTPRGKKPRLASYNDALRDAQVYDLAVWRRIQWLGDIRNLCDHKDNRDPTDHEVTKLIDGTEEVIKTIS